LKRQRSVSTVNWELRTLRATLATARRWGLIERNPFAECTLCPVPERSTPYFTTQDFEKLLIAIGERRWLRDAVMFAIQTGLRRGELLSLTWQHVDFTKRLVLIESSQTFKTKGGKRRFVPLSEPALALLRSRQ
jgi:integrase